MILKSIATRVGLLLIGLLFSLVVAAQNREPQNIYRVTVKSRYVLENGQRTKQFFAIGQLISDSLGRLHTEIDYDWETHYPHNYRWHYFTGQTKYRTDFFLSEKLVKIEEYTWNSNGKLTELIIKKVSPSDTVFVAKVMHKYSTSGTIQQTIGYNSKGKKTYTASYKYDSNGTEIERKIKGKRANPPDSILFLSRIPIYDSSGRVIDEILTVDRVGKGKQTHKYSYSYDANGNLINHQESDVDGKQLVRKEFTYRKDNRIQQMKQFDANDNLVDWLAWRYEIYKTNDRRQRVLE